MLLNTNPSFLANATQIVPNVGTNGCSNTNPSQSYLQPENQCRRPELGLSEADSKI